MGDALSFTTVFRQNNSAPEQADALRYIEPILRMQRIAERAHFVQFYQRDNYLIEAVGAFVAKGFVEGQAAIIIATPEHLAGLANRLAKAGIDVFDYQKRCLYYAFNAERMLSRFMLNGKPDAGLFRSVIGPVISTAASFGSGARAYGEMVALLWREGKKRAAIELELLWNDLANYYSFTLMCGYPSDSFTEDDKADGLRQVCNAHSCVLPHEDYSRSITPPGLSLPRLF